MANRDRRTRFAQTVDWNLFKNFYQIGRLGGIGAAARQLNRQQPSMSIALLRLEDFLGAKLCDRSARGIRLTPAGQALFSACESMNDLVEAAAPQNDKVDPLEGSITLRVISNLHLNPTVNAIFQEFHARFPLVEIKLDVAVPRRVVEAVQDGDVEIGIGFAPTDGDLELMPICDQVQQLYCGPGTRFFGVTEPPSAALASEPIVLAKDEPDIYTTTRARYRLGQQIGGVADNLQERLWLVSLGMGLAFLPKPVVDASAFAATLWPLLPDRDAPVATVGFMTRRNAARSAAAACLLDVARHAIGASTDQGPLSVAEASHALFDGAPA